MLLRFETMNAVRRNKRKKEHRSNSTKVAAFTQLKAGLGLTQVSREMDIPPTTLKRWRRESMASDLAKKIARSWKILGRRTEDLYALTYSMPGRVEAVVEAEGDVTKY